MNKTVLLSFGLCMLSLGAGNIQASNPNTISLNQTTIDVPHGYEEIELKGSLMLNSGPNAVEAGVNENSVYIQFNQNLGYVNVTIINPYGWTIYNDVVNTAVQQILVVPISFTAEGIYTIILDNADDYADGDFEKN